MTEVSNWSHLPLAAADYFTFFIFGGKPQEQATLITNDWENPHFYHGTGLSPNVYSQS